MPHDDKSFSLQVLTGTMRQYVIDKVKKPLIKAITTLARRFPEPTRENCQHPNTLILFDIWDKFFEYEDNPRRGALFQALKRLSIAEYEHDPYYRDRIGFFIEELVKAVSDGRWQSRSIRPMSHWKEPGRAGVSDVLPLSPEAWSKIEKTEEPQRSLLIKELVYSGEGGKHGSY